MEQLLSQLGELIAIAGMLIGAVLWLNQKLEKLKDDIARNLLTQSVTDAEIAGQVERLELMLNGNREAIAHTRDRFFQELDRLEKKIESELGKHRSNINQVIGWLDKNTEFHPRQ